MAAAKAGLSRWRAEAYVDSARWGVFGYSRGAIAASLLAVTDTTMKAAVLGGGIYDLRRAYGEISDEAIRANMKAEIGPSDSALVARSSLPQMAALRCPVLIIHGAMDTNAPVNQAYAFRDRLQALGKSV